MTVVTPNTMKIRPQQQQQQRRRCRIVSSLGVPPLSLLLLLLLLLLLCGSCEGRSAIPGTTQTVSGYDTEMGTDAICWESMSAETSEMEGDDGGALAFPNPLLPNFVVSKKGVTLLRQCPAGNNMTGAAPDLSRQEDCVFRTGRFYNYTVSFQVNMTSLGAAEFLADEGEGIIAVQVLLCVAGISGFCSPFIHEEANVRVEELFRTTGFTEVRSVGFLHGGTHVHSPYLKLQLPKSQGPVFSMTVDVPIRVNHPGSYYAITALQLYYKDGPRIPGTNLSEIDNRRVRRFDMANALAVDSRLLTYSDPLRVLRVPSAVMRLSLAVIGLATIVLLALLGQLVWFRRHEVLLLAQGHWLMLSCGAALVATMSAFLHEPENNLYCTASFPLTLVSLQVFYAITIGRIWRVHALVSPLLRSSLMPPPDTTTHNNGSATDPNAPTTTTTTTSWCGWLSHLVGLVTRVCDRLFPCVCCKRARYICTTRAETWRNNMMIRRKVTDRDLLRIVSCLVVPQVALQVCSVILQPRERWIELSDDKMHGRYQCAVARDATVTGLGGFSFLMLGVYWLGLSVILLLVMAQHARQLPSLLNETQKVFDGTLTSVVILVLGLAVIALSNDPATSPGVTYLVLVSLILSITLNTTIRIVWPPLDIIHKGETILVSQLVQDHAEKQRQRRNSSLVHVSGVFENSITDFGSSFHSSKRSVNNNNNATMTNNPNQQTQFSLAETRSISRRESANTSNGSLDGFENIFLANKCSTCNNNNNSSSDDFLFVGGEPRRRYSGDHHTKIMIREDQAPSKRLIVPMVALQERLAATNKRVLTGYSVSRYEWETISDMIYQLGCTFHNKVTFAWEEQAQHPKEEEEEEAMLREPRSWRRRNQSQESPHHHLSTVESGLVNDEEENGHCFRRTTSNFSQEDDDDDDDEGLEPLDVRSPPHQQHARGMHSTFLKHDETNDEQEDWSNEEEDDEDNAAAAPLSHQPIVHTPDNNNNSNPSTTAVSSSSLPEPSTAEVMDLESAARTPPTITTAAAAEQNL